MAVSPVLGRGGRRPALGPRRLRHEGGLAAAVAAALRFVARGDVPGSISFLVTGDEEGPSVNGTAKLLDWALAKGEAFDHCIVGEPTSVERLGDTIKNGRRGSLTGRLTLRGRQGHVAYPQIADNPLRASRAAARRAVRAAARFRQRRFRSVEPRSRDGRRRQSGDQRHPRRGSPRLQRALQRPLDA